MRVSKALGHGRKNNRDSASAAQVWLKLSQDAGMEVKRTLSHGKRGKGKGNCVVGPFRKGDPALFNLTPPELDEAWTWLE